MLDNNLYNLMLQLTQENKSLWRIKNEYLKDAQMSEDSKAYWQSMEADKEKHVSDLLALVKKHI